MSNIEASRAFRAMLRNIAYSPPEDPILEAGVKASVATLNEGVYQETEACNDQRTIIKHRARLVSALHAMADAMPDAEPAPNPERIVMAALLMKGETHGLGLLPPAHHGEIIRALQDVGFDESEILEAERGFITDEGRFVDRTEGWRVAEAAGQIIRRNENSEGMLYSENLW